VNSALDSTPIRENQHPIVVEMPSNLLLANLWLKMSLQGLNPDSLILEHTLERCVAIAPLAFGLRKQRSQDVV
jgi:hypothetical protein